MRKNVMLSDITHYSKGTQINGDDLLKSGDFAYLNGGITPSGFWNTSNVQGNTVTISEGGNSCGFVNYMPDPFWCGAHCYFLYGSKLNEKYLYYALKSQQDRLMALRTGACMPNIKKNDLGRFQLNIESDESIQSDIVYILSHCERIISQRERELAELNTLIKAQFVELFGDPIANPFNWPAVRVKDIIRSCEAGWSGNGQQRKKQPGEIAVLKVSAVTKGYFLPEECKVLDDQQSIKRYVFPEKGDLLFSRANTREMVGATAIIMADYPELILPDKLWKIRFKDNANVFYMKYMLSSEPIREKLSASSTGTSGSMFNVSMDKLGKILIPLPPINVQSQFAAFVAQIDKSKFRCDTSRNLWKYAVKCIWDGLCREMVL